MFIRKGYILLFSVIGVSGLLIFAIYSPIFLSSIENIEIELEFNRDNAYDYVKDQVEIGDRIPGTQAREDCAQYFIDHFQSIDPNYEYYLHNFTVEGTECQNVLFKLNSNEEHIVILGAHYDSRARATKDDEGSKWDDPVPGANDGASGCGVLLELANAFHTRKDDLDVQLWFLFFDAEDQGVDNSYGIENWGWIEGSTEFANDIEDFYDKNQESIDSMILLDMVGGPNLKFINEGHSRSSLLDEIFEIGRQLGYTEEFPLNPISESITDDHVPFANIGIPTADLIINFWNNLDWPYHHTTEDNMDHISRNSLKATGETVEQFIYNNYYNATDEEYQGNFPYEEDINIPPTEIIIFIISVIGIIGISVIAIYLIRNRNLKRILEEEKGKNDEISER